ncbi:hypothetical protein EV175_001718 [Coemansia sp. RSA 1933]|nr:hypothetical protein EV175_001718 [Coemansia sp. RSA 1933]
MSFSCSISGEAPKEPVISARTGNVYERRLLQKYIDENGREPQTDHALAEDEIIGVRADPPAVKPRPPTLTSIPALLSTFQNEWDALVLETFTLKQQQQQVRQELSQALYQNDAACRVIARLMRERDEARQALVSLQAAIPHQQQQQRSGANVVEVKTPPASSTSHAADADSMDVDNAEAAQTPEEAYHARAAETAKTLSAARMKREAPADLTTADAWRQAKQTAVIEALHTSTKPGITALITDAAGDLALTGAMDNHAEVYSRSRDQTVATLKGHTKKLTAVAWVSRGGFDQRIITGSADKSIRIWDPKPANAEAASAAAQEGDLDLRAVGWAKKCIIKEHSAEIAGLSMHPSGEYFASAAVDGSWAIHSVDGSTTISERLDSPIAKIAFHPDGMFLGIATADGKVKILDIKQRQVLATLDASPDSKPINGLHFSENGYYFATTCDHEVAVWDLRKQKKAHSWTPADIQQSADAVPFVAPARFDVSGKYLAIVSDYTLHVFKVKGWQLLASVQMTMEDEDDPKSHSAPATIEDIAWVGPLSSAVAAVTKLNSMVFFAPPLNE